jgi:hypothetical protein
MNQIEEFQRQLVMAMVLSMDDRNTGLVEGRSGGCRGCSKVVKDFPTTIQYQLRQEDSGSDSWWARLDVRLISGGWSARELADFAGKGWCVMLIRVPQFRHPESVY